MEVTVADGVVRKIAGDDGERQRLGAEAAMLSAAAHPGIVRLIATTGGDLPSELVLAEVGGRCLASAGSKLDWSEISGLGAALATTLADLHEIGIVHRSISAEHVLLDECGRPVLCGFGHATRCDASESRALVADDVASLAALLLQLGEGAPPRSMARVLRSYCEGRQAVRRRSARRLARGLVDAVPSARLPGIDPIDTGTVDDENSLDGNTGRGQVPNHRRLCALALAIGCAVAFVALMSESRAGGGVMTSGRTGLSSGCPPAGAGCRGRAVASGSVLSAPAGSFMLIGTSGLEVIGRWHCGGTAVPALLDVRAGNVWVFDYWPTDPAGVVARLVARVPEAFGLRVVPGRGNASRCDELLVERQRQSPIIVNPSR